MYAPPDGNPPVKGAVTFLAIDLHRLISPATMTVSDLDTSRACREAGLQLASVPSCVLRLDVECLQNVEALHGPAASQAVRLGISSVLRETVRPTDVVRHEGQEHFTVVFSDSPLAEAIDAVERSHQRISGMRFRNDGPALTVEVRRGMAVCQPDEDLTQVVQRANQALQIARAAGSDAIFLHDGCQAREFDPHRDLPSSQAEPPSIAAASAPLPSLSREEQAATLSELCTRTVFCQDVRRCVTAAKNSGSPVSVVLMELASTAGATATEALLAAVTRQLRSLLPATTVMARYKANALGLLLPTASLQQALGIAGRLIEGVEQRTFLVDDRPLRCTLRLGVAEASARDDMVSLLTRAESGSVSASSGAVST